MKIDPTKIKVNNKSLVPPFEDSTHAPFGTSLSPIPWLFSTATSTGNNNTTMTMAPTTTHTQCGGFQDLRPFPDTTTPASKTEEKDSFYHKMAWRTTISWLLQLTRKNTRWRLSTEKAHQHQQHNMH
jgi:hypothetical protein